jgi:maltokinase
LEKVADPGKAIRVHGDYHLGQTMRTDEGWFVLDFEGEPARPVEERRRPSSPLKDVTGMLRSFDYAGRSGLSEWSEVEAPALEALALAWADRNRRAFLRGYLGTAGIETLLPSDQEAFEIVLSAFELDKAIYELGYEQAYRPTWVDIPRHAIRRLVSE